MLATEAKPRRVSNIQDRQGDRVMKKMLVLSLMTAAGLAGCAGFGSLKSEEVRDLPLVKFGDAVPANQDFILYFPAGQPIPTVVQIQGNLFDRSAEETVSVTLRKDIYAYKDWVSFDRQHWIKGNEALGLKVNIQVPSYRHPGPGSIKVEFNEKPKS
jgi:hypothetical protein